MNNEISIDLSGVKGTGKEFESSVLYKVPWQVDINRTGFQHYSEAINKIRAHQPEGWNPTDPPTKIANDIHYLTSEEIGLDCSEIKLYTALGSSLDRDHGVDAWLEFKDPEYGDDVIITLDITKNPSKYLKGHKANVIGYGKHADIVAKDVADYYSKIPVQV